MHLYRQYLSFIFKNMLRSPRQALKLIPSLAFLIIGLGVYSFRIITEGIQPVPLQSALNLLFLVVILLGTCVVQILRNGALGFRAADANFLMPAPVSSLKTFTFIILKSLIGLIGIGIFFSCIYFAADPFSFIAFNINFILVLFIASYIQYIIASMTERTPILISKLLLIISFLGWLPTLAMLITQVKTTGTVGFSPFYLVPVFGTLSASFFALITQHFLINAVAIGVNIILVIILYQIAKRMPAFDYEKELRFIAKTEAAYKRAMSGKGSSIKKVFAQSTRQFKNSGAKVLLDRAWITAGKWWFVDFESLFKTALIAGSIFFVINMFPGIPAIFVYMMTLCASFYILVISSRSTSDVLNDIYLYMLPIKTVYKVTYPLVSAFTRESIYALVPSVLLGMQLNNWGYAISLFASLLALSSISLLNHYTIQPLFTERFLGNTVNLLVNGLVALGIAFISLAPIFFIGNTLSILLSVTILYAVAIVFLLASIYLYDHTEKGEKTA